MTPIPTHTEIKSQAGARAASRSQLYALLSRGFRFPSPQEFSEISSGTYLKSVESAVAGLPYPLAINQKLLKEAGPDLEAMKSAYMSLFDVGGAGGPPCSLYEGHHAGGRNTTMEEALKFYHYFGLRLGEAPNRELPDHMSIELEFMHALTYKEALTCEEGKAAEPYWRAQRDFLERHLGHFTATIAQHLAGQSAPFYPELARLAAEFCQGELAYVSQALGSKVS